MNKLKKIEAFTYCENYSDFLAETLPTNVHLFDNYTVITSTKDKDTIKLCDIYRVKCLKIDKEKILNEDNEIFFKGYCLNEGLKTSKYNDWVISLDADIWLPPRTRQLLDNKNLNEEKIYGIDRMMCNSYEDWIKFKKKPKIHEGWIFMFLDAFPMGVRNVAYSSEGFIPIGFFQMWNIKKSGIANYPIKHCKKEKWTIRSDTFHTKQWPPENRGFIPEIVAIHLASSNGEKMGINWQGRKTPYFGIQ